MCPKNSVSKEKTMGNSATPEQTGIVNPFDDATPAPSSATPAQTGIVNPFDDAVAAPDTTDITHGQALPAGEMRAGPNPGVKGWLNDVESDIRHGGQSTVVGRALHALGAEGTDVGAQAGAGDSGPASLPLGVVKAAQGVAEGSPTKVVSGALQAATLPLAVAGGPGRAIDAVADAVPSKAWAAKMLESVVQDAGGVPVNLNNSGDKLLRVKELADAGTSMPQSVGKLLRRATDPEKGPLTYNDARDFYSNITRLSADEYSRLAPQMKRAVGEAAGALKQDIGEAADAVGRAADYYAGIKDYANAYKLSRAAQQIGKAVGLGAAGVTVDALARKAYDWIKK